MFPTFPHDHYYSIADASGKLFLLQRRPIVGARKSSATRAHGLIISPNGRSFRLPMKDDGFQTCFSSRKKLTESFSMLVSSMPESPIAPIVKPDIFDYAGPILEDIFAAYSSRDRRL